MHLPNANFSDIPSYYVPHLKGRCQTHMPLNAIVMWGANTSCNVGTELTVLHILSTATSDTLKLRCILCDVFREFPCLAKHRLLLGVKLKLYGCYVANNVAWWPLYIFYSGCCGRLQNAPHFTGNLVLMFVHLQKFCDLSRRHVRCLLS